ncbi:hypothetical protein BDY19DRAFT_904059 [Irpex rosettiformis]|uniref:Uncharacterized protein n=1 Tax=Irpex rosettiformis TaxID=378272 RepID=A0ACB8UFC9_9APHY|nr:hypothetical protein BDY19DRAFT_904059 [Irpex rosettiformis]
MSTFPRQTAQLGEDVQVALDDNCDTDCGPRGLCVESCNFPERSQRHRAHTRHRYTDQVPPHWTTLKLGMTKGKHVTVALNRLSYETCTNSLLKDQLTRATRWFCRECEHGYYTSPRESSSVDATPACLSLRLASDTSTATDSKQTILPACINVYIHVQRIKEAYTQVVSMIDNLLRRKVEEASVVGYDVKEGCVYEACLNACTGGKVAYFELGEDVGVGSGGPADYLEVCRDEMRKEIEEESRLMEGGCDVKNIASNIHFGNEGVFGWVIEGQ